MKPSHRFSAAATLVLALAVTPFGSTAHAEGGTAPGAATAATAPVSPTTSAVTTSGASSHSSGGTSASNAAASGGSSSSGAHAADSRPAPVAPAAPAAPAAPETAAALPPTNPDIDADTAFGGGPTSPSSGSGGTGAGTISSSGPAGEEGGADYTGNPENPAGQEGGYTYSGNPDSPTESHLPGSETTGPNAAASDHPATAPKTADAAGSGGVTPEGEHITRNADGSSTISKDAPKAGSNEAKLENDGTNKDGDKVFRDPKTGDVYVVDGKKDGQAKPDGEKSGGERKLASTEGTSGDGKTPATASADKPASSSGAPAGKSGKGGAGPVHVTNGPSAQVASDSTAMPGWVLTNSDGKNCTYCKRGNPKEKKTVKCGGRELASRNKTDKGGDAVSPGDGGGVVSASGGSSGGNAGSVE